MPARRGSGPATADALARVRAYRDGGERRIVGLMTGTSGDAIDAALVRFRGIGLDARHEVIAYRETPLEPALRREVLEVAAAPTLPPERLMRLDAALGESYCAAVLELLAANDVRPETIDAIGCHGQTVRHLPRGGSTGVALTLQIGSAAVLAERTGIAVVSNFRARDTAAGGEGAPLVSLADWWLARSAQESRALLNLGGIANLTHLPRAGALADVLAFDTGPGNAVMDALAGLASNGAAMHDDGGASARRGRVSEALLGELLDDPYFDVAPPRSTGREHFGRAFAERMRARGAALGLGDDDVMATALELTAASVGEAVRRFLGPRGGVDAVYASGGGVRNPVLMAALARRLAPARLDRAEAVGIPSDGKEALAFAFLAHMTLCGLPGNVPGATGAAHAVVLGQITPGVAR
jgi:anhydro-N-acetylmuramic acid kinase